MRGGEGLTEDVCLQVSAGSGPFQPTAEGFEATIRPFTSLERCLPASRAARTLILICRSFPCPASFDGPQGARGPRTTIMILFLVISFYRIPTRQSVFLSTVFRLPPALRAHAGIHRRSFRHVSSQLFKFLTACCALRRRTLRK